MLSRIAERVYWIGRHVERADCIARLVTTYHRSATQLGALDERSELHDLMAALGEHDGDASFNATAGWWVAGSANSASIVASFRGARENARGAREVLSLEMWEALNEAATKIGSLADRGSDYSVIAERAAEHCRAFSGVVESTVLRDETWEILRLGTMLERSAMTLRAVLIGAQAVELLDDSDPLAHHAWILTLRACSALDAYRRTNTAIPNGPDAVRLLLKSTTCPRSVEFSLREAQASVPYASEASSVLDTARRVTLASVDPYGKDVRGRCEALLGATDAIHDAIVGEWRGRWESA